MIGAEKQKFYKALGIAVKRRREFLGMTVAMLSKESGEQNKTIRSIENGRPCSLHHMGWLMNELSIGLKEIYDHMEEENDDEKLTLDDLI